MELYNHFLCDLDGCWDPEDMGCWDYAGATLPVCSQPLHGGL